MIKSQIMHDQRANPDHPEVCTPLCRQAWTLKYHATLLERETVSPRPTFRILSIANDQLAKEREYRQLSK